MEQIIKSRLAAVTTPPTAPLALGFTDLFEMEDFQTMQSAGLVNDHLTDCFRHGELSR